ncbi:prefoldin subunit 2-like [Convolutriloba macropyga]|uniref:prefoldin subunit 2-like n=1 Tax=Convolutriloba macropyga TaxID=536237 RepID=UPI003F520C01
MTSAGKSAESSSQQPSSSSSGALSKPTPKQEEIIKGFQKLRQEQHAMSEKVSEIKSQISEHKSVIAALEKVSEDRKCYRMVDQALVERKVADVLPELKLMKTNLENTVNMMQQQLEKKGSELVEYKSKHDIRIQGEQS